MYPCCVSADVLSFTGSIQDILRTGKVAESSISDEAGGFAKTHRLTKEFMGGVFVEFFSAFFKKKQRLISFG